MSGYSLATWVGRVTDGRNGRTRQVETIPPLAATLKEGMRVFVAGNLVQRI